VPVTFDVKSDGSEVLSVGSDDPLTYQTGSIGPISSVVLEAATQIQGQASWSNVTVNFYKGGSLIQSISPSSGPSVNTSSSSTTADQTMTITPTDPSCDEVLIAAAMQMTSTGTNSPSSTAMFCNVFVNGS
jgi:hypothetical protein